ADRAVRVRIVQGRRHEPGAVALREGVRETERPLGPWPAEVVAAPAVPRLEVDLLARILADIADVQMAVQAVEARTKRVTQAERPDLAPDPGDADEWIVRGDRVRSRGGDVQPHDLAEQRRPVLRVPELVTGAPAIAERHVEGAIGTEPEPAAVVV